MGILYSEEEIVYHFFTETEFFTGTEAVITGPDVNHIKNVLRMKPGEKILLSIGKDKTLFDGLRISDNQ